MVHNIVIILGTGGYWAYHGDHFIIYATIISCSRPETNIILYINYISIKNFFKKQKWVKSHVFPKKTNLDWTGSYAAFPRCLALRDWAHTQQKALTVCPASVSVKPQPRPHQKLICVSDIGTRMFPVLHRVWPCRYFAKSNITDVSFALRQGNLVLKFSCMCNDGGINDYSSCLGT